MTTITIDGVKGYVSNGQAYYYLRKSGERILDPDTKKPIDPRTDLAAFVARVEAMKRTLAAQPAPAKAGTLLALIEAWRGIPGTDGRPKRDPSPEWQKLKPATQASYERMIDPERGRARHRAEGQAGRDRLQQRLHGPRAGRPRGRHHRGRVHARRPHPAQRPRRQGAAASGRHGDEGLIKEELT
jgi:hypothetical protein